jgi:hypothetical protein
MLAGPEGAYNMRCNRIAARGDELALGRLAILH